MARANKNGGVVVLRYIYECGTVLHLEREKDKANYKPEWKFNCEAKVKTLQ